MVFFKLKVNGFYWSERSLLQARKEFTDEKLTLKDINNLGLDLNIYT